MTHLKMTKLVVAFRNSANAPVTVSTSVIPKAEQ
jgi:hypothetical protein